MNIRHTLVVLSAGLAFGLGACNSGHNTVLAPPPPATTLAGTVSAVGGGALDEYVSLTFTPTGGGAATMLNTTATGTFDQALTAGSYDVVATRPGYEEFSQGGVVVVANVANALDIMMMPLPANTYIGSTNCGVCHDAIFTTFRQSAHPYKISKVIGGVAPTFPFTTLPADMVSRITDDDMPIAGPPVVPDPNIGTDNTLGTPGSWADISYVIGGYNWKARFIDAEGFIITGSSVQYNYATDGMVAYHNNETDKPFNCGNCHTTGWQHFDATVNNQRQDGLDGMDGTFTEQGIGCESCHGAGSTHAQTELAADITETATPRSVADFMDGTYAFGKPVACGECHTRDGEHDYPSYDSALNVARAAAMPALPPLAQGGRIAASGGLVRHHEQYDEILGIDPDTLESVRSAGFMGTHGDCTTCHDPHATSINRDNAAVTMPGVDPANASCLACHQASQYDPANNLRGSMTSLNCIDCHMPKMAKSAVSTTLTNGVVEGDVTSHAFRIDLSGAPQFTGSFSYPYITGDWACRTCHGSGKPAPAGAFALPGGVIPMGFDYHPN